MAIYVWSALTNNQVINFNPALDVLNFDSLSISAADVFIDAARASSLGVSAEFYMLQGGKLVFLKGVSVGSLTTTNVSFANGSLLLVGDNTTIIDNGENLLSGTSGNDQLIGANGSDTFVGGLGDDVINGGNGFQDFDVADCSGAAGSINVNLLLGTATGAAGTDTLTEIEIVFGGTFDDSLTGNNRTNFLRGNQGNDTLNGGGQSDVELGLGLSGDYADYRGANGSVIVNLTAGTATGADGNDTLINFENIRGSNFDDLLTGNSGSNFLRGGLGNDTLDGAGGVDFADYRNATAGVTVNLTIQGLGNSQNTVADGVDTLVGIEGIQGSDFADTLTGNASDNFFAPRLGNETIDGGAGFDIVSFRSSNSAFASYSLTSGDGGDTLNGIEGLEGSDLSDTLTGRNGEANVLRGFFGNDTLRVTTGDDTLDGGANNDTVVFSQSGVAYGGTTGISVNLASHVADLNTNSAAAGEVSTLISIEIVFGTAGNDIFVGGDIEHSPSSVGNTITEVFNPTVSPAFPGSPLANGSDTIIGGTSVDFVTRVDYTANASGQAVNVNLRNGFAQDGIGFTDTLFNVEQVYGGAGSDTLTGGSLQRGASGIFFEVFRGNAGNDTIDGANAFSDGDDASNDRVDYASSPAINVNLGTGIALDGFGGTDRLINIDQVYGGSGNDALTGSARNEMFDGGSGLDTIDGGAGSDEVRYQQSTASVIVNLSTNSLQINGRIVAPNTAFEGFGSIDTLIGIENVRGSDFNDYIRGSDDLITRQFLLGDAGNDTIDGGAGVDFANYSLNAHSLGGINAFIENGLGTVNDGLTGIDTLINIEGLAGTHSADMLTGGQGDQWFRGNGGKDTLNGGAGSDWVTYGSDPSGVVINLGAGTAIDGWNGLTGLLALGGNDTLLSIENAEGSKYNDTIIGGAGNNALTGGTGNDIIGGNDGADTAIFSGLASAYTITRSGLTTTVSGPDGTDTLTGIEKLQFSDTTISTLASWGIDPSGDSKSDVLWRNSTGEVALWLMDGLTPTAQTVFGAVPVSMNIVDGNGDYNGDGKSDILWRNSNGDVTMWLMDGVTPTAQTLIGVVPNTWTLVDGHGDYNGDGKDDLLWRTSNGDTALWLMFDTAVLGQAVFGSIPTSWSLIDGSGDYNGDGRGDLLWRNSAGDTALWLMDGLTPIGQAVFGSVPTTWNIVDGHGDYNGDGMSDLLWRNSTGDVALWLMNGLTPIERAVFGSVPTTWSIVEGHGDYNGDGNSDVLWRNSNGDVALWLMSGVTPIGQAVFGSVPNTWTIVDGHSDYNGDGMSDLLWRNSNGDVAQWLMSGLTPIGQAVFASVPTTWSITTELGGLLSGDGAADTLTGTTSRDTLIGNGGADTLAGGSGADSFQYSTNSDSTVAASDYITDFAHGQDKIDLTLIDANTITAGDQAFLFGGNNTNTVPNSVTWSEGGDNTTLHIDNTGDTTADMQVVLTGVGLGLTMSDFGL